MDGVLPACDAGYDVARAGAVSPRRKCRAKRCVASATLSQCVITGVRRGLPWIFDHRVLAVAFHRDFSAGLRRRVGSAAQIVPPLSALLDRLFDVLLPRG